MSRNTPINESQLGLYRREWSKARRVLRAAGFSSQETEDHRYEIHRLVTGSDCSSKDLTNRTLDGCLKEFAKISSPFDGRRQADLADGPSKRVRWQIQRLKTDLGLSDAYVETIAVNMHRRSIIQCDEPQLKSVLAALTYHEIRHKHDQPAQV
jgi:hypothetical protein